MKFNDAQMTNLYRVKQEIRDNLNRRYIELKDIFPKNWNYGSGILTGGAIGCLLRHEEPKDWDIFFRDSDDACLVGETFVVDNSAAMMYVKNADKRLDFEPLPGMKPHAAYKMHDDEGAFYGGELSIIVDGIPKIITDNAVTLNNGLQLITMQTGTIEQIHSSFDFVHCTIWYDIAADQLHISTKQYILNINKTLELIKGMKVAPALREKKYFDRGFNYAVKSIGKGTLVTELPKLEDLPIRYGPIDNSKIAVKNGPDVDLRLYTIPNFNIKDRGAIRKKTPSIGIKNDNDAYVQSGITKKQEFDDWLLTGKAIGSMGIFKSQFVTY